MVHIKYDHKQIEKKWQKRWEKDRLYETDLEGAKKKFYNLIMFPYPSAAALHVGHVYCYGGADTYARFKRMQGYDVFEPMGFDAFGIHAENYAIQIGEHPQVVVPRNVEHFREDQMKRLGAMFDWSREVNTTDPEYYRWTQWIFVQLYKAGLVERKKELVDWCPSCKTVLANEQVIDGACERCKTTVEQKALEQWFFKITAYADRLLAGLEKLDWPERTKTLQTNWIGKKTGIDIVYRIEGQEEKSVTCFTTRPETNFGATFVVLAPEHPLVDAITTSECKPAVDAYREEVRKKSELERTELSREKSGAFTGAYCINDLNGERMPIWVGDFVLMHFGSGAVVGVPAHDVRDFEFAQMAKLPVKRVLMKDEDRSEITEVEQVWEDDGVCVNSDFLDGMSWREAREAIMDHIEKNGWGKRTVDYRIHDWCVSRQRYWGPPIPMIYCPTCAEKARKMKVLIIFGTLGKVNENWYPWLIEELQARGISVACPELPDADEPNYEDRMAFLEKNYADYLTDDTLVIGHSSGAATALHLAERHQLRGIVLVAPYHYIPAYDRDSLHKDFEAKTADALIPFLDRKIDYKKVRKNVQTVVALFGRRDPWVKEDIAQQLSKQLPGITIRRFEQYGHFATSTQDPAIIPEILDFIPATDALGAGWHPVPETDLPVHLPQLEKYEPDGSGRGPLATAPDFVSTICPVCGAEACRETDVSDTFLDSAWYQLRYPSTHRNDAPFDRELTDKWLPVDMYIGGIEHATMHLIYFRFITMVLHDLGYFNFDEPATKLRHQGLIIKDGAKMSKSRGNVVNPDEYIEKFGADAFRTYMLFIGPYEDGGEFNDRGILGASRFFEKLWDVLLEGDAQGEGAASLAKLHATIKKVGEDLEELHFNTAIAALMELVNWVRETKSQFSAEQWKLIKSAMPRLLAPFAPFLAEELWEQLGNKYSIHDQPWPEHDATQIEDATYMLAVQVNGKLRDSFEIEKSATDAEMQEQALAREKVQKWTEGKEIRKVISVPGRLINIVV
ncbi:MAG TPA: leucine--tRNA ligase [bacterium]|nr:leucine--tRNA ligase [bacterium]